jgi:hypothetical protein
VRCSLLHRLSDNRPGRANGSRKLRGIHKPEEVQGLEQLRRPQRKDRVRQRTRLAALQQPVRVPLLERVRVLIAHLQVGREVGLEVDREAERVVAAADNAPRSLR